MVEASDMLAPAGARGSATYYSHAMAALPPRPAPRRPRPGSLERPVNGRLYRGTWLLVGIPLLAAAFSVSKAGSLPAPQPTLPPSFDRVGALELTRELSRLYPDRAPGTAAAAGAAQWVATQLAPYSLRVETDRFRADVPGRGRTTLVNQVVTVPGRSPDELVVMAHRDDDGTGPGANDNASGIATLIELARSYGAPATVPGAQPVSPVHTLVFVATDGGAFGNLGARHFAETHHGHVLAALELEALAGRGPPRLLLTGEHPRLAAPGLVETASQRVLEQNGTRPARPGALSQLIDLGFPVTLGEQGSLLAHGLPALALTTGSERPPSPFADQPSRLDGTRLAELGRAAQQLLRWLDSGAELAPGTATYVYFGPRTLPGWSIELVLIAALAPFFLAAIDLFAHCRRRHIPLAPALRSYRSRAGFWLWTAALLVLAVVALLVIATNPFALVFLLPSLHAWLWLPNFRERPFWTRAALFAAGFIWPLLLLGSLAFRYGLGLDAPWYLAELISNGYVGLPAVGIGVTWLAAAGQVAALAAGRYAPYPSALERPPRGPIRETIRRVVLTVRARRRASELEREALEG